MNIESFHKRLKITIWKHNLMLHESWGNHGPSRRWFTSIYRHFTYKSKWWFVVICADFPGIWSKILKIERKTGLQHLSSELFRTFHVCSKPMEGWKRINNPMKFHEHPDIYIYIHTYISHISSYIYIPTYLPTYLSIYLSEIPFKKWSYLPISDPAAGLLHHPRRPTTPAKPAARTRPLAGLQEDSSAAMSASRQNFSSDNTFLWVCFDEYLSFKGLSNDHHRLIHIFIIYHQFYIHWSGFHQQSISNLWGHQTLPQFVCLVGISWDYIVWWITHGRRDFSWLQTNRSSWDRWFITMLYYVILLVIWGFP